MNNLHNHYFIHTKNEYKIIKNSKSISFFDLKNFRFVELEAGTLIKLNPREFFSYVRICKSIDGKVPLKITNQNGNLFIIEREENALFDFLSQEIDKGNESEFIKSLLKLPADEIAWEYSNLTGE